MKKLFILILSMCVMFGAMAFTTDPPEIKKASTEFTITQDQSVDVIYDLEKPSFDFTIRAGEKFIIAETAYIEKMPSEFVQYRWQPGNYSYNESIKDNTLRQRHSDKTDYRYAHIGRWFSDKRSC
jgi:hypothetical protein